jgi:hypothetical protein
VKKLLLLIPIIVLIIGCGGDDGTNYFPLTVDNEWNYDMTITTIIVIDTVTSDTTVLTGTQNQEITAETVLDNGTAVFEETMIMTMEIDTLTTIVDTSIFYIEETEDYLLGYDTKADTIPDTVAVLPPETGKTWNVDDSTTAEYIGQESVTVPAGTFSNCWKMVQVESTNDTTWIYLAENVGPVKINWTDIETDTTNTMLMELETYTIK